MSEELSTVVRPCTYATFNRELQTVCILNHNKCSGFNTACPLYEGASWDHLERQREVIIQAHGARGYIELLESIKRGYYDNKYSDEFWERAWKECERTQDERLKSTLRHKIIAIKEFQIGKIVQVALGDAFGYLPEGELRRIKMTESERELFEEIKLSIQKHWERFISLQRGVESE
jgi:hypothetical protein